MWMKVMTEESHKEDRNDNDELKICIKPSVEKNTNENKEEYGR